MRGASIALIASCLVGVAAGLGSFTFVYARGSSYLTNDPAACANCHVMSEQYAGWMKSSHRSVAVCNDCHTPHTFVGKYTTKMRNGFWHSFYFTSGTFPEPIQITESSQRITEATCRDCHSQVVDAIDHFGSDKGRGTESSAALQCTGCHRGIGHIK